MVAVTATATNSLRDAVVKTLGMDNPVVVSESPDKPNGILCAWIPIYGDYVHPFDWETKKRTYLNGTERIIRAIQWLLGITGYVQHKLLLNGSQLEQLRGILYNNRSERDNHEM